MVDGVVPDNDCPLDMGAVGVVDGLRRG